MGILVITSVSTSSTIILNPSSVSSSIDPLLCGEETTETETNNITASTDMAITVTDGFHIIENPISSNESKPNP